jgi:hypothetical protein
VLAAGIALVKAHSQAEPERHLLGLSLAPQPVRVRVRVRVLMPVEVEVVEYTPDPALLLLLHAQNFRLHDCVLEYPTTTVLLQSSLVRYAFAPAYHSPV